MALPLAVVPGQPLAGVGGAGELVPGAGTFTRAGGVFSSLAGRPRKDGNVVSVHGAEDTQSLPEPGNIVIGTVLRLTRQAATISILLVDGAPCRPGFIGQLRTQDIRATGTDNLKVWTCFRPGDVVRSRVIALGDSRTSLYLSTAQNHLGVVFAVNSRGTPLEPTGWEGMKDPLTGEVQSRKVAGPE